MKVVEWETNTFEHRGQPVTIIFRKAGKHSDFEPWLLAAPSAILARNGFKGKGLYAMKRFKKGTEIGTYAGTIVGKYKTQEEGLNSELAKEMVLSGRSDKLVTLRCKGEKGWCLIDGDPDQPPCIPLVNDPKGTGLRTNCILSEWGILRSTASSIPAFDIGKSVEENVKSELRISYGDGFWNLIGQTLS